MLFVLLFLLAMFFFQKNFQFWLSIIFSYFGILYYTGILVRQIKVKFVFSGDKAFQVTLRYHLTVAGSC